VNYGSRREEEIEEPISPDDTAQLSVQHVGEDHEPAEAGYQYKNLQEYLHGSIVEGRGDVFALFLLPMLLVGYRIVPASSG